MDIRVAFGRRVKMLREQRGLTQQQLAEGVARSIDAISMIERGKNWPSVATIEQLASVLGVSAADLFDNLEIGSRRNGQDMMALARDALRHIAKSDLPVALAMLQALAQKGSGDKGAPSSQ